MLQLHLVVIYATEKQGLYYKLGIGDGSFTSTGH
jgi:hypothetical protein